MDVEWAKDGNDNKIYIVQARPETVHATEDNENSITEYIIADEARKKLADSTLLRGKALAIRL